MCLTSININQCTSSAISYNNIHFFFRNHVYFFAKKKAYAGSFAFLFQFEEIGCRIATNACGGLWRQCFIGNDVQRLVSPTGFNDDNFDLSDKKRENRPWKVENCQVGSFGQGRYPIAKNVYQAIGCFSSSHFHAATCHGEGFKKLENGCRMN